MSWACTAQVWEALGQSKSLAEDAGYYSNVFILMVPAQIGLTQLTQFFSAQRIMMPEVVISMMALTLNLLLGLVFVLGIPFEGFSGYGFKACPIITVCIVWFQFTVMIIYYEWFRGNNQVWKHINDVSGTFTERKFHALLEGITEGRVLTFVKLYFPAALALSSDYWRMGLIGAMAIVYYGSP